MPSRPIEGILIAGTRPRCGKTVAAAGMSAALNSEGLQVQAIKPVEFYAPQSQFNQPDQRFLDKTLRSMQAIGPIELETPYRVSNLSWTRIIEVCRRTAFTPLIEVPGSVASPLRVEDGRYVTAADLAEELGISLLVVTEKSPDVVGMTAPALAYLAARNAPVMGWIAVQTTPTETPHWEDEALYLSQEFRIPCLGALPYSPTISVESLQVGNLLEIAEAAIDLFPLQQALKLCV